MSLSRAYVEFGLFVLTVAAGGRELESFGKLKGGVVVQWLARRAGGEPPAAAQPVFGEQQLCFVPRSTVVLSTLERGPKTCPPLQNQHSKRAVAHFSVKKNLLGRENFSFPQLTFDLHFVLCHTTVQSLIHDSGAILNTKLSSFLNTIIMIERQQCSNK